MKKTLLFIFAIVLGGAYANASVVTPATVQRLPNAYTLSNMQAVYDTYNVPVTLQPTDLYVKFMPQDSLQLQTLVERDDLELFNYPLDIELENGDVYVETGLPATDLTWLYTTVNTGFSFPSGIPYQVIDTCYIPADGESIPQTRGGVVDIDVEDAAFLRLGYSLSSEPETRASSSTPQGFILFEDEEDGTQPLKGTKIRCHRLVKWTSTYTDENGYYSMPKSFKHDVHYAIVFENEKDFDIWGNYGPIACANYNMGWHSKNGHSEIIPHSENAWSWCVINNAAYDYYEMCEQTGIALPPANLKIWDWRISNPSSAPMLRRINHPIGVNSSRAWLNYYANIYVSVPPTYLNQVLKFVMPDVTIGTLSGSLSDISYNVFHELSHASHFSVVGSAFWAKYISYIITYGAYGDGTGNNHELCGIGEMWGYYMGDYLIKNQFGFSSSNKYKDWIYWGFLDELVRFCGLSNEDIFNCLTPGVRTYEEFYFTLTDHFPDYLPEIKFLFYKNDMLPTQGTYRDMEVCDNWELFDNHVLFDDVSVSPRVELKVQYDDYVKIKPTFVLRNGSTLKINKYE